MLEHVHKEISEIIAGSQGALWHLPIAIQEARNESEQDEIIQELRGISLNVIGNLMQLLDSYPSDTHDQYYLAALFEVITHYFSIKSPQRAWDHFANLDRLWRQTPVASMSLQMLELQVSQYYKLILWLQGIGDAWSESNILIAIDQWVEPMYERMKSRKYFSHILEGVLVVIKEFVFQSRVHIRPECTDTNHDSQVRPLQLPALPSRSSSPSESRSSPPFGLFFSEPASPVAESSLVSRQCDCDSAPLAVCLTTARPC